MAKPKATTQDYSSKKPKTSIFLCCFGSSHANKELTTKGSSSDPILISKKKKKNSWFSGRSIRVHLFHKNSTSKTVPLEASISDHSHYSKTKSKSTLQHKSQTPSANPSPPPQPPLVLPGTPYYTPTQTRHGPQRANNVEDTRQQGKASPAHTKRQARRLSSSVVQTQTTPKKAKNAGSSYDAVVGMSVLAVTLVIMILWGRLCAILCTSAWLYCTQRFKNTASQNDNDVLHAAKSSHVDFDSEEYKKKVIMEGLLGRNHRTAL